MTVNQKIVISVSTLFSVLIAVNANLGVYAILASACGGFLISSILIAGTNELRP